MKLVDFDDSTCGAGCDTDCFRGTGEYGFEAVVFLSGRTPANLSSRISSLHSSEARRATEGRNSGAFEASGGSNGWVERLRGLCGPDISAGFAEVITGGCR